MISSDCSLMRSRSTLDKSSVNQSGTSSSQSAVKHAAMNEQINIKMFKFSLEVETSLHNDNLKNVLHEEYLPASCLADSCGIVA